MEPFVVSVFLNQFIVCASFYNLTFIEYAYFICILIVDNRWAIAIVVRVFMSLSNASCTRRSDSVSRAEVASSRIRIGGFFKIARAMLIRWRCPPESLLPRSPILVLYPSGFPWWNRAHWQSWLLQRPVPWLLLPLQKRCCWRKYH